MVHVSLPYMYKQIEGFILTGSSIDRENQLVLKLYGQSDAGSFIVTINQFHNYFFVESKNQTSLRNLDGTWVEKIECQTQAELKSHKLKFESQGLKTFEADIRPLERYLMDNHFYAQVTIKGEAIINEGILTFLNPDIQKGHYYPECKIMSFDI